MNDLHSDAFVFFGATGDLAYKKINPDITFAIGANVIAPGQETSSTTAEMLGTDLPNAGNMDAYERVLGDAMHGDATLFAREDYVEEAWRIVDPILKSGSPMYEYEPGTWGPREVDARVLPPGGWHNPKVAAARTETVMTLKAS